MPRIPQAVRQTFASGVATPQVGIDVSGISGAGAALQRGFEDVANVLEEKRQQELTAKAVEFNSQLAIDFDEQYTNAIRDQEVIDNPSLARERVDQIAQNFTESESFLAQPPEVQRVARQNLQSMRVKFMGKAIDFDNDQTFDNTVRSLNRTQDNLELRALTTDDSLSELLKDKASATIAATVSGVMTEAQGEEDIKGGSKGIVLNRVQKLLNDEDVEGAKDLINDSAIKEILGADDLQRAQESINRKNQLRSDQADKLNSLRLSKPWEYLGKVDREQAPALDLTNPSDLSDSLSERMAYVERKNKQFGTQLSVLKPVEIQGISTAVDAVNAQSGAQILFEYASSVTQEQQDLMGAEIFKVRPDIGSALSLADDDPQLSQMVLNGAKARKDKLVKMPEQTRMITTINEKIAKAVPQIRFRNAIHEVITNAYASKLLTGNLQSNEQSGIIDEDTLDDLLTRSVGPVIETGGRDFQVLGFRKPDGAFITEDEFDDTFSDLDNATLLKHGAGFFRDINGNVIQTPDVVENGTLVMVGNGKYTVELFGEFVVGKDKKPYVLDMKKIFEATKEK